MDAKTYLKVSAVNLMFLAAGALISPLAVKRLDLFRVVHAQTENGVKGAAAKVDAPKPPPSCDPAHFECVTPGITTGAAGFGIVLANKIAADQLMVNGYDPLKLHDGTLTKLQGKGLLTPKDVEEIVAGAKVAKPLRANIPQ